MLNDVKMLRKTAACVVKSIEMPITCFTTVLLNDYSHRRFIGNRLIPFMFGLFLWNHVVGRLV